MAGTSPWNWIWSNMLRPSLAYLLACLVAGIILVAFSYLLMIFDNAGGPMESYEAPDPLRDSGAALFFAYIILRLTALPVFIVIFLMRWAKLPRGYSDAAAGALLAIVLPPLYLFLDRSPDELLQPSGFLSWHTLFLPAAGVPAALVYWLAAGRPRARRRP